MERLVTYRTDDSNHVRPCEILTARDALIDSFTDSERNELCDIMGAIRAAASFHQTQINKTVVKDISVILEWGKISKYLTLLGYKVEFSFLNTYGDPVYSIIWCYDSQ